MRPPDDDPRRCTATSKRSGVRCRAWAMTGARTCRMHGSSTRAARTAAKRRLADAKVRAWLKAEQLKREEEILTAFGTWENYRAELTKARRESFEAMLDRVLGEAQ